MLKLLHESATCWLTQITNNLRKLAIGQYHNLNGLLTYFKHIISTSTLVRKDLVCFLAQSKVLYAWIYSCIAFLISTAPNPIKELQLNIFRDSFLFIRNNHLASVLIPLKNKRPSQNASEWNGIGGMQRIECACLTFLADIRIVILSFGLV